MELDRNIFQKYSFVTDDDDNFEIGELGNFSLDLIAPKLESKKENKVDAFSEDALLCKDDSDSINNGDNQNLRSIFELFEN